jgi:hypothetical protein
MRKLASETIIDPKDAPRRPSVLLVLGVIVVLVSLPMLIESARACTAQWRHMVWGQIDHVETPIINALGARYRSIARTVRLKANAAFTLLPWQPSLVIALGLGLAFAACVPLRKAN